jgi:hypothetical protein
MHNLIILGSGRSGTSMAAGLFNKAGYFMGDDLFAPNSSNPKGFFENKKINTINEDILWQVIPRRPKRIVAGAWFFSRRPSDGQLWLSRVPLGTSFICPDSVKDRIRELVALEPFCFKDPRFSYTLPCWQPLMKHTRFLVVFRNPADTVKSILKECKHAGYLRSLSISRNECLKVWQLMYSHILNMYRADGSWFFLHYDQMLDGQCLSPLEAFAGAKVDRSFPERSLKRSISNEPVPAEASLLYHILCELANYRDDETRDGLATGEGKDWNVRKKAFGQASGAY